MIKEWVKGGELTLVVPLIPSLPTVRYVFGSGEVMGGLDGPWDSACEEERFGRARAAVDTFISGTLISARMPPSRNVSAQIALLDEAREEVWEMRVRAPRPGVRVFGRFSERDCFIALTVANKEELVTNESYRREMERCKREWKRLFPSYEPLHGEVADDYISNVTVV